jgi:hypothetical protein
MKRVGLALAVLFAAFPAWVQAEDAYTNTMLRGMKTAVIFYTEKDTPKCLFERGIEKKAAFHLGAIKSKGLQFVTLSPESSPPDASVLLMLEASDSKVEAQEPLCNIFVKFEVFHQMSGKLRYSDAEPVLRVLAYRTFHVGSAPAGKLTDAVHKSALSAFGDFADSYEAANR